MQKGMRNILAHEYGKINDELVFEAITGEITADAEEFIASVLKTTGLAETLRVNNLLIPTSKFTYGAKNSQIFKIGGGWMNQP
jgi:hypothetical protein